MTTVIAVHNSEGCVGRCDANCHDAKGSTCTCICGGRNHGKGLNQAVLNNQKEYGLTQEDLERFAAEHNRNPAELILIDRLRVRSARKANKLARMRLDAKAPLPLFECTGSTP